MIVTQTVDIPENRRITLEVPSQLPVGKTILIFKPAAEAPLAMTAQEAKERGLGFGNGHRIDPLEAIKRCSGITKKFGINLTSDDFLAMSKKDKTLENRFENFAEQHV